MFVAVFIFRCRYSALWDTGVRRGLDFTIVGYTL